MNRSYQTQSGEVLSLGRISPMAIQRIEIEWKKKRPKAPIVEVVIADHATSQANYEDPGYKQELEDWEGQKNLATMKYLYSVGVKTQPPDDFVEEHRLWFPEADERELRFLWVSSLITTEKETEQFMDFLLGQTSVTPDGIREAEQTFPGDGGRPADLGIQVQGPPASSD